MSDIFRVYENKDPERKERCNFCFGKGHISRARSISDGTNWHLVDEFIDTVCPKCRGKKEVMAGLVMDKVEGRSS
jgi:RecJ-like exonuclease